MGLRKVLWSLRCDLSPNIILIRHKEISVFMVTIPYLNLLVKPIICFMFSGKKLILKDELPFKMH